MGFFDNFFTPEGPESAKVYARKATAGLPYLGEYTKNIGGQLAPWEQQVINALRQVAPQKMQLSAQLLNQFGPQLAAAQPGITKAAEPEYFSTRGLTSGAIGKMLSGMDPNAMTPGELESATRGVNRSNVFAGTAFGRSPTTAIANAGTFGQNLSNKRAQYMQGIGTATAALPTFRETNQAWMPQLQQSMQLSDYPMQWGSELANALLGYEQAKEGMAPRSTGLGQLSGILGLGKQLGDFVSLIPKKKE